MKITPRKVHETIGKYMLADGFDFVLDMKKSKGAKIYDSKNKKWYIDFFSFFASNPLGMNHPKMNNAKFIRKIGKLSIVKPSNSDIYTVEMAEFVDTFARIAMPKYMKHLFFVSGGALAVENALKTAFDWKTRLNFERGIVKEADKVIHFKQAFHGRTGYTLALTNTFDPRKIKYFPKFEWPRITNPKITFPIEDHIEEIKVLENKAYEEIDQAIKTYGNSIAAIIIEPIQGEGGDNHFRPEFLQNLKKIADENDLMFIVDEVQSGMGLTGKWWAHQHADVEPDIICFGKKAQVCGIMVGEKVDRVKNNVFEESSRINSTWGGNLVDMVRAQRFLEIIVEDNLVENAAKMGDLLLKELLKIAKKHKNVSNVRGKGLMCAFDLPTTEERNDALHNMWKNGLLVLPCGEKSIRFRPTLDVDKNTILEGIKIIDKTV
ncbi:L-lysine 6-transaminase [candidate division WOR-3 bacterium]|nr:L-lysine 6-transaminase [candidate division WOR-3 bacterium]